MMMKRRMMGDGEGEEDGVEEEEVIRGRAADRAEDGGEGVVPVCRRMATWKFGCGCIGHKLHFTIWQSCAL